MEKEEIIDASELKEALIKCIIVANEECFPDDIAAIRSGKQIAGNSILRKVNRFIDSDGVPKTKGRFIIIGQQHPLSSLIIADAHNKVLHSGEERTLSEVRWSYYLVAGQHAIRKIIKSCRQCKMARAKPQPPMMANLPKDGFQGFPQAFTNIGLDFFGPLTVVIGRRSEKRCGLLITCLVTRAVHLEVVHSMSSDLFIISLRRFIVYRGKPDVIFSDNGTNIVAGERELREGLANLNARKVREELAIQALSWRFSPPFGPHFGGAWDRLVQSSK
ncbi:uncharacterized protein LOC123470678 [Daphnia magna]|uniref:uncharacterized protein LOC123470678 n=1 Tax=Daphnia magna TaxID=35525 RepID=UPI001E1BC935|nr:uncharacterized protein LOC123470678 [Daphnia magna]